MISRSVLITAPTAEVISLAECKTMLGISSTSQDGMITAGLSAAVSSLDPATGGWLGRALRPQTWELRLSEFPYCSEEIRLPFPVLTSVTSVKYDDAEGIEQTLTPVDDYQVLGVNGLSFGSIVPAYNKTWPSARCNPESVRVRYVCGYYDGRDDSPATADKMPDAIKQGVAMMVRSILSNTERNLFLSQDNVVGVGSKTWVVSPAAQQVMQQAAEALLYQYQPMTA